MQFGIREICDVVFKAKTAGDLGDLHYVPGQPVLYIDSAKTSTMEGTATTAYATGGKGNSRLIAWEGEKTLTFTVEDALLSEMGFAILSGAGLFRADDAKNIHVHMSARAQSDKNGNIDLSEVLEQGDEIDDNSPVFVMGLKDGSLQDMLTGVTVATADDTAAGIYKGKGLKCSKEDDRNKTVFVDFYVTKKSGVYQMEIDVENFAGYYYVEASTLFRRQSDGKDLPAELIFPNVKIQSNFTFSMAATGDPSTFTFTMDAMPGYTRFNKTKKVLCAMQVVDYETTEPTTPEKDSTDTVADADLLYPITGMASVVNLDGFGD